MQTQKDSIFLLQPCQW